VRERLAQLGVRSLEEADRPHRLLERLPGATDEACRRRPVAAAAARPGARRRVLRRARNLQPHDRGLAARMVRRHAGRPSNRQAGGEFSDTRSSNTDRSIGARLSGEHRPPPRRPGHGRAPDHVALTGSAGPELRRVQCRRPALHLEGEANDYVGKGMAGGKHRDPPPRGSRFVAREDARSSATPACTAPPAASCSPRAAPASASRCATPARRGGRRGRRPLLRIHDRRRGGGARAHRLNFGAGFTGGLAYVLDESATSSTATTTS
jgi:glutamate synthase (NADPH/NADH) large chain